MVMRPASGGGISGSGGSWNSTNDVVACSGRASDQSRHRSMTRRGVDAVEVDRPAVEGRQVDQVELDGGHDARRPLAAAQGEEQVGVLGGRHPAQHAVTGDDVEGAHPVGGDAVGAGHRPDPATGRVADDADVARRAVERPRVRSGAAASMTGSHLTPAPTRAQPSGCTASSSRPLVAISRWPAMPGIAPWPVACTPAVRPWAPAKRTAATTSSAVRASTTAAGCTWTARFHGDDEGVVARVAGRVHRAGQAGGAAARTRRRRSRRRPRRCGC